MARKQPDHLRAGSRLLAAAGLTDSESITELENAIGSDPVLDLAIVHRIGALGTAEAGDALLRIERAAGGDLRREIKRARYRLEQRGVAVARPSATPRTTAPSPAAIEAYVSAFDGGGDRMVWLVRPRPGGVLHLFAVVNDPKGLREVSLNPMSRKALREIREEIRTRHEIQLVPIDWRRADRIILDALAWAVERSVPIAGDYIALRAELTAEPLTADDSVQAGSLSDVLQVEEGDLGHSDELFAEPELRTWLLDEDITRDALRKLVEIRDSPLVLEQTQVVERFRAVTDEVVNLVFGGDARTSWQRRFDAMAHFFEVTARPAAARRAAAVTRALRDGRPPGSIPFCEAYVQSTLAAVFASEEENQSEALRSSLVVTPEQVRRRPR